MTRDGQRVAIAYKDNFVDILKIDFEDSEL